MKFSISLAVLIGLASLNAFAEDRCVIVREVYSPADHKVIETGDRIIFSMEDWRDCYLTAVMVANENPGHALVKVPGTHSSYLPGVVTVKWYLDATFNFINPQGRVSRHSKPVPDKGDWAVYSDGTPIIE